MKNKKNQKVDELVQSLAESVATAKSAVQASEKWIELIAKELGVEADAIHIKVEELTEKQKRSHDMASALGEDEEKVIEGIFDGQNMITKDDKQYPVPANYASKSKLVEGDGLKLMIQPNGAFVYKQIQPAPRKLLTGRLVLDGSQYQVLAEGKTYNVLYASVTFFRGMVGDDVTIVVPEDINSNWAAIENVLPEGSLEEEEAKEKKAKAKA